MRLSQITPEQCHEILMEFADSSTALRARIEHSVRVLEEAEDARGLQAERRREQAANRRMRTPLNFEKLLHRVEN